MEYVEFIPEIKKYEKVRVILGKNKNVIDGIVIDSKISRSECPLREMGMLKYLVEFENDTRMWLKSNNIVADVLSQSDKKEIMKLNIEVFSVGEFCVAKYYDKKYESIYKIIKLVVKKDAIFYLVELSNGERQIIALHQIDDAYENDEVFVYKSEEKRWLKHDNDFKKVYEEKHNYGVIGNMLIKLFKWDK